MRLRLKMKFLLELVTCCGASTFRQQAPAEETRSLVPPPERRRKKGRVVVTRRGRPVAEWRPSLSSISEDTAPLPEKSDGVAAVTNRKIRKVASATSSPRPPQYRDENGRSAGYSSSMVPTLSPTPFLF
nr:Serine/threonine-protein kinase MRCK gamma like [Ipomoea batatas]GMC51811.1 Serine/threonine-protein kinase MRCK gamma like [Ipomoea batatas]